MQKKNIQSLLNKGYFIIKLDKKYYRELRNFIIKKIDNKNKNFKLNDLHKTVKISNLNKLNFNFIKSINKNLKFKNNLFNSAEKFIEGCVGSEICSSDVNLSIQMPNDDTSLLEMHADFFSGESLFQINLWIPFVNVKNTQSMFIIEPSKSFEILKKIKNDKTINFQKIHKKYSKNFQWLNLKSGEALIFSPNCLHGNTINKENKTRISINIRYKNIFSPYNKTKNEKKIGGFYKMISPKAVTLFNLKHNFDEIIQK